MSAFKYTAALLIMLSLPSVSLADIAGRISFVSGQATILDEKNNKRSVFKGDLIHSGEKVETASDARVQLRLTDGSLFILKPSSLLEINQYQFNKSTPHTGTVVLNFIKGSVRAMTGAIAKANSQNYVFNTSLATLNVYSTDYTTALNNDTLTLSVNEGKITLANTLGVTEVESGQTFEVKKNQVPSLSKNHLMIKSVEEENQQNVASKQQSSDTPQRPRLENFTNYNEFIQAVYLYKKAQEELNKPKIIIPNLPSGQITPEYTLMDNGREITNWGEDITNIVPYANNEVQEEKTTQINIQMDSLNPSEMGRSSVADALGSESFSLTDILEMEDKELSLLLNIDKYDDFDDKRKTSELLKRLLKQSIKTNTVGNDIHIIGIEMGQPDIQVIQRLD